MLTERDYKILTAGFLPEEIGTVGGHPYIKRSAIHRRLRLIDPAWSNHVETYIQVDGDTVTAWGSITLKGVTRYNCATKKVNCWASKENGGARFSDADVARELANAKMKAVSALIFRCAEAFEIGLYLKEKRTPHTLASVLNESQDSQQKPAQPSPSGSPSPAPTEPPAQSTGTRLGAPSAAPAPAAPAKQKWTTNGGVPIFNKRMEELGLTFDDVCAVLEPGRLLTNITDISLSLEDTLKALPQIADQKKAKATTTAGGL